MNEQDSATKAAAPAAPGRGPWRAAGQLIARHERRLALGLLLVAPMLLASNMLVARAVHDQIPPVALAFWRWAATFVLLIPFTLGPLWRRRWALAREWPDLLLLGALGMGVCGAFVYIGAETTTATNIGLIYAASPILIVLLAWARYGEALMARQVAGAALCLLGVLTVIFRGDPGLLLGLQFTLGDLWILAATVAWAWYSVLLRHRPSVLPLVARFAAIVAGGVLVLLPFHLAEIASGAAPAFDRLTVATVLFLAAVSSCAAYLAYGFIQRALGAGPTGLLMYLIPLYNAGLAFVLLGERLELHHLAGAALVLPGLFLATRAR
jgi:drug/metabolite transporter (DMT)-like permease